MQNNMFEILTTAKITLASECSCLLELLQSATEIQSNLSISLVQDFKSTSAFSLTIKHILRTAERIALHTHTGKKNEAKNNNTLMQHNSHELDQSLVVNSFVSSEPRSFRVFVFIFRRSRRCVIAYNFYRSATIIYHIFISIFNSVFCWSSSFPFQSKNATTVKKPETHEIQFLRFKINIIHSFTSTQTHIRHKIMDTFFDFSCFVLLCFCFSYDHDWNRSEYSRVIAIWSNITSTSFVLSVPNPDDDDFFSGFV